tara:strand:+ start:1388 stop:2188 length:801 start_codon:yes stop_codon:yes gene_type:complete
MENSCIICENKKFIPLYEFKINEVDKYKDSNEVIVPLIEKYGEIKIVKCSYCGFGYVIPKFENNHFDDIYKDDYWTDYQTEVGEIDIRDRVDEFILISKERIDYLTPIISKGKLLDVGCSMGFLVAEAKNSGFDAHGIDLNKYCVEKGKEMFDVDLISTSIEDYDNNDFDIILSYNTIEHVSRPDNFMLEISKKINSNGIVGIGTHDLDCLSHLKEGRSWKHIIPSEHLFYFTEKSLAMLGEKYGLKKIYSNKPIDNLIVVYFQKI